MTRWHSLFSLSNENIADRIDGFLQNHAYQRYDPFGEFPGMAYPQTLKIFIAPAQSGWVRVLFEGNPEEADALAADCSADGICLSVALDAQSAFFHVYINGNLVDLETGLPPYIQTGHEEAFHHTLKASSFDLPSINDTPQVGTIPIDDLPADLQALTHQVKPQDSANLFQRMSRQFLQSVGPQNMRDLFETRPDWDSQGGQYIRSLMTCLLPAGINWRTPDFATLRSVYTILSRKLYRNNLSFLPGDEDLIATVPDALHYQPIYGGKFPEK